VALHVRSTPSNALFLAEMSGKAPQIFSHMSDKQVKT